MSRLKYETQAGNFSESVTFQQLTEHLTKAEEACYALGHYRKENSDKISGQAFLAYGQILGKARETLGKIMTLDAARLLS